jgi:hypothetical protein
MIVSGHNEFTITQHSSDEVIGEMPVQPGILNPFGVVHAGTLSQSSIAVRVSTRALMPARPRAPTGCASWHCMGGLSCLTMEAIEK